MKLTKEQLNNLLVFLKRTQLQGVEAPQFLELVRIIETELTKENGTTTKDTTVADSNK